MLYAKDALKIANYFYQIDKQCRKDLNENHLVSERDYVSRFTTLATYPNGFIKGRTPFFISQTLPSIYEQKFGCDGILIFKKGQDVKVGMFEAKWPRMRSAADYGTQSVTDWDNVVKGTSISRFSSELERQLKISKDVVIWEMFFNDSVPSKNSPFDSKGSACVLLEVANDYVIKTSKDSSKAWNKKDLKGLLNHNISSSKPKNIEMLLVKMLTCNIGKKIPVDPSSDSFNITFETDDKELISAKHLASLKKLSDIDSGISNLVSLDFKSDKYLTRFLSETDNVAMLPREIFNEIGINIGTDSKEITNESIANYFQKLVESYSLNTESLFESVDVTIPFPSDSEIIDDGNLESEEPLPNKIRTFMKTYGIAHYYFIDLDKMRSFNKV